jgi:hypothetical protein
VTTPEDKETQRVCEYWNVNCIQTDRFFEGKADFRKGAGVNTGLAQCEKSGWLIHMDADVVLPPLFREIIDGANLDTKSIYGIDRFMCKSYEEWQSFVSFPKLQHENGIYVHTDAFPIGVRIWKPEEGGFTPIGFFQMWHINSGVDSYPEEHKDAARGDLLFALQWPRARRHMLPEIIGYHLESESAEMGVNWNGRTTKRFGPPKPAVVVTSLAPQTIAVKQSLVQKVVSAVKSVINKIPYKQ